MAAKLFYLPFPVAFTSRGVGAPGAKAYFYETGTTTPLATYADDTLSVEHPHPIVANASGRFPEIYLDNAVTARCIINDSLGAELCDVDPYVPGTAPDAGSLQPYADAAEASAVNSSASASSASTSASSASTHATNAASSASGASASATAAAASAVIADAAADAAALAVSLPSAAIPAANRTALKLLSTSAPGHLMEAGREGMFVFDSTDLSALVSMDTAEAVHVAPSSDPTGASGAWVRRYSGPLKIEWFGGGVDKTGAENLAAMQAASGYNPTTTINFSPTVEFGIGSYSVSATFENRSACRFVGQGHGHDASAVLGERATRLIWPVDTLCIRNHSSNTVGSTSQAGDSSMAAQGSTFERLSIEQATQGTSTTAHGVQMRATAAVKDCAFRNIAGNALEIKATAGSGGSTEGDANNWQVDQCIVHSCGGHALHVGGTDANAGICTHFITKTVGGCGIFDESGLGANAYIAPQISGYGGNITGRVSSGGRLYVLLDPTAGIGASTTPGTNNQVWYDVGAGASYPAWSGAGTYNVELPILIVGASTRSVVVSAYVEGSTPSHIASNGGGQYVGGQAGWTRYSGGTQKVHNITEAIYSFSGVGGYKSYSPSHSTLGAHFEVAIGAQPAGQDDGVILSHSCGTEGFYWAWQSSSGDYIYNYLNAKEIWRITGPGTAKTFGRGAAVPHMIQFKDFALCDPADATHTNIIGARLNVPASGEFSRGDFMFNWLPGIARPVVAYSCYSSGTSGSWLMSASITLKDTTASRPAEVGTSDNGVMFLDTTLHADGKPIWWNGVKWIDCNGNVPGAGIGYTTGVGGAVTQATSRTTGVTLNKLCGAITLVSAAGSATWATFTVTNSTVAATDTIRVNQKSGTDKYQIHVTAVGAGSFDITFATTGGTTTEQPVFNFSVIKAVAA